MLLRIVVIGAVSVAFAASAQPVSAKRAPRVYQTTADDILDVESGLLPVQPAEYAFIDAIIDEAKKELPASIATRGDALAAFQTIDKILIRRNVIYPGIGLVQYLHDGLTPTMLNDTQFQAAWDMPHNLRRRAYMAANKGKPFYILDCDTASFLYLAVADALHLPIRLVEIPGHNFVRWTFSDGSHLNFETMDGVERSDEDYIEGWAVPPNTIKPGFFMTAMTHDQVMGYVYGLRGGGWELKYQYAKAKRDYHTAKALRPQSPAPFNAESWIYATCTPTACRSSALAIKDGLVAVDDWRTPNYLDTLACAYASSGDFTKAAAILQNADPSGFAFPADQATIKAHRVCQNQSQQSAFAARAYELVPRAAPAIPKRFIGND
jgi:hypothetical protein